MSGRRTVQGPIVTTMRALIIAVTALLTLAPIANATPQDDQFLANLTSRNIGGQPDKLIGYGLDACNNYGTAGVVDQIAGLEGIGYTHIQAEDIFVLGVHAYCPEKLPPVAKPAA
jgi:Protein of unknown function (DUF732)